MRNSIILNGKEINVDKLPEEARKKAEELIAFLEKYNQDRHEGLTEADMPEGLNDAEQFYWRQDHGFTSSAEDAFGF